MTLSSQSITFVAKAAAERLRPGDILTGQDGQGRTLIIGVGTVEHVDRLPADDIAKFKAGMLWP